MLPFGLDEDGCASEGDGDAGEGDDCEDAGDVVGHDVGDDSDRGSCDDRGDDEDERHRQPAALMSAGLGVAPTDAAPVATIVQLTCRYMVAAVPTPNNRAVTASTRIPATYNLTAPIR